jgi:hypothetical protein
MKWSLTYDYTSKDLLKPGVRPVWVNGISYMNSLRLGTKKVR